MVDYRALKARHNSVMNGKTPRLTPLLALPQPPIAIRHSPHPCNAFQQLKHCQRDRITNKRCTPSTHPSLQSTVVLDNNKPPPRAPRAPRLTLGAKLRQCRYPAIAAPPLQSPPTTHPLPPHHSHVPVFRPTS
eukprot:GFKZ01016157.1.p1 GENE.GFKZ01016157.1~~GFKZ01016157.1.p1  ORF type:complete len:133 (+),score=7.52 GFKZ01016157.1:200-598(+)